MIRVACGKSELPFDLSQYTGGLREAGGGERGGRGAHAMLTHAVDCWWHNRHLVPTAEMLSAQRTAGPQAVRILPSIGVMHHGQVQCFTYRHAAEM